MHADNRAARGYPRRRGSGCGGSGRGGGFSGEADAQEAPELVSSDRLPNELSLGPSGLSEFRTSSRLSVGATYTRIVRGEASGEDFHTVDVALTTDREEAA